MTRKLYTKRAIVFALLFAIIFQLVPIASADDSLASFEQSVPFGVAHSEDGADISLYKKPSSKTASDSVHDYQICAVVSSEKLSGRTWYRINYFDDDGYERSGYIADENFYQLTVAGLVTMLSDPDIAAYLMQFSGMDLSATFVTPGENTTRSNAAAVTESPRATDPPTLNTTYVLNTNTKKFHLPSCSSAADIKAKNRRDFTGTREEVINMGYQPCKRCNP